MIAIGTLRARRESPLSGSCVPALTREQVSRSAWRETRNSPVAQPTASPGTMVSPATDQEPAFPRKRAPPSACSGPDPRRHASTERSRSRAETAGSSAPTYLRDRTKLASLAATAAGSSLRRNGGRRGRVRRLRARPGRRRGQQGALLAAFLWVLTQEPDVDPVRVPEATGAPIRRHRRRDRYRLDGVADQPPPGR